MNNTKKYKIIRLGMYIASVIMMLVMIPAVADISYDVFRQVNKGKGYTLEQMYESFSGQDYTKLIKQVQVNIAAGKQITDEDRDFYAFAACYESAVNYHMYVKNGDSLGAARELSVFNENSNAIGRRIFKDTLESVKKTYGIE